MAIFRPGDLKKRITDITIKELKSRHISGLLLDVDNTLTRHGDQSIEDNVLLWLQTMKDHGMKIIIVSNAKFKRVRPFAEKIGLEFVHMAAKPLPFGFRRAAKHIGIPLKQCAAIGDQIFTDVMGANLAGVQCIQVLPIELEYEKPFMMFKRRIENRMMDYPYDIH